MTGKIGAAIHAPTHRHWETLDVVIRDFIVTAHAGLLYPSGQKRWPSIQLMSSYTESKISGYVTDRKYTSGAVITYNGINLS